MQGGGGGGMQWDQPDSKSNQISIDAIQQFSENTQSFGTSFQTLEKKTREIKATLKSLEKKTREIEATLSVWKIKLLKSKQQHNPFGGKNS